MKFTESHEWIKIEAGSNIGIVGITDHAQKALGDIVYVELPKVGSEVKQGAPVAVIESTKAATDVYSPASGKIEAMNEHLNEVPETVNKSAEQKGWLFKIRLNNVIEIGGLMDDAAYRKFIEQT